MQDLIIQLHSPLIKKVTPFLLSIIQITRFERSRPQEKSQLLQDHKQDSQMGLDSLQNSIVLPEYALMKTVNPCSFATTSIPNFEEWD